MTSVGYYPVLSRRIRPSQVLKITYGYGGGPVNKLRDSLAPETFLFLQDCDFSKPLYEYDSSRSITVGI